MSRFVQTVLFTMMVPVVLVLVGCCQKCESNQGTEAGTETAACCAASEGSDVADPSEAVPTETVLVLEEIVVVEAVPETAPAPPITMGPGGGLGFPPGYTPVEEKAEEAAPVEAAPVEKKVEESATLKNLQAAFNGESNASAKYAVYADKSDELEYPTVAALFRAASKAESIHAKKHATVIQSLDAKPTADIKTYEGKAIEEMLADALAGETYEFTEMYPEFIKEAEAANESDAVVSFEYAMKAEVGHAKLYQGAIDFLAELKTTDLTFFVCPVCGFTTYESVDSCPICMTAKERFLSFKGIE